ncbi:MAG: spore germination protein GerW family protein [Bacillota bacterium]
MEFENQIKEVLSAAMDKLHAISDAGTVLGKAVETADGKIILPVSKVTLAYIAGGGEYTSPEKKEGTLEKLKYPFAGGSGGYVQLSPIGFLAIKDEEFSTIPFQESKSGMDRMFEEVGSYLKKAGEKQLTPKNKE